MKHSNFGRIWKVFANCSLGKLTCIQRSLFNKIILLCFSNSKVKFLRNEKIHKIVDIKFKQNLLQLYSVLYWYSNYFVRFEKQRCNLKRSFWNAVDYFICKFKTLHCLFIFIFVRNKKNNTNKKGTNQFM